MKTTLLASLLVLAASTTVQATILSVSGSGLMIAPPALIGNGDSTNNSFQQGFNERQGVFLSGPLAVDGGSIGGGFAVDSHMIFFNRSGSGELSTTASWTFSGTILGVMSDVNGTLEAASTSFLGSLTTSGYPAPGGFTSRGMEPNSPDGYSGVGTTTLSVTMTISQPGDWIRVITRSAPDGGSSVALLGLVLLALSLLHRGTRSRD